MVEVCNWIYILYLSNFELIFIFAVIKLNEVMKSYLFKNDYYFNLTISKT